MARSRPSHWLTNGGGVLLLSCVLSLLVVGAAAATPKILPPHPANPFADPRHDPYNPLKYIASNALTGVALGLVLAVALAQSFMTWKIGGSFMLAMVIAEYTFAIGLGTRFGLHSNPESKGLYIVEYLFVVLSPCGFIAAEYVLLGRLARFLKCDAHLLIPPKRITLFFVMSDVTTFLIQAAGGSLSVSASTHPALGITGSHIFLAGLAAQLCSFFLFTCLYLRFLYRVYKHEPGAWTLDEDKPWYKDWRSLGGVFVISCIGILIRSVYRTIELSEGFQGHLTTSEAFFYGLDTLPLFVAIAVYVPFWPGRFIPNVKEAEQTDSVEERERKESG